jgi:AraC family transcriptional regulator
LPLIQDVAMAFETVERQPLIVVGMQIDTQPMSPQIPALWPQFVPRIPEIRYPTEPNVSYGVMRHAGAGSRPLQYMAAIAVRTPGEIPTGMRCLGIPGGTYAVFRYPLSGLARGFCEIFERLLPGSDRVQIPGPYFERYDESFDPTDASSLVEIQLPVRRRREATR